jgi:hypothetical protein
MSCDADRLTSGQNCFKEPSYRVVEEGRPDLLVCWGHRETAIQQRPSAVVISLREMIIQIEQTVKASRGAGLWIVVTYGGRTGHQLAHVERTGDIGNDWLRAKKWRKNSLTMTRTQCKIGMAEIIRIATPDDIRRAGLTKVGG